MSWETRSARMHRRRREKIAEQAEARRQFEALPKSERLQILHDDISAHGDAIAALFNCPMQVTIIARSPDNPEREVLITSDTWEGIDGAVVRAKERES